jgi:hypothetical protein
MPIDAAQPTVRVFPPDNLRVVAAFLGAEIVANIVSLILLAQLLTTWASAAGPPEIL